jgi:hypothetical protein
LPYRKRHPCYRAAQVWGYIIEVDPALAAVRDILLIAGFDVLHETAYECALEIERYAAKLGFGPIVGTLPRHAAPGVRGGALSIAANEPR